MASLQKPPSPFYPGQPVPVELFVGRNTEFEQIQRSSKDVAAGKPDAIFLVGDYGIGKTSLAKFSALRAKVEQKLFPIHVLLGGAQNLDQLTEKTLQTILRTDAFDPTAGEKIRKLLGKYVGEQEIFGFKINLQALTPDLPDITRGFNALLESIFKRVSETGYHGILFIMDEINGIAANPQFAHFLKTLVDENALLEKRIPLLLMLCGTERIRQQIVQNHQPVERIFHISEVSPLSHLETSEFFDRAFSSTGITANADALDFMATYSGGLPKLAHIIGDQVYFADTNDIIDLGDAMVGVARAAEEVGRKFVDPKAYDAIRSPSYKKMLPKLADLSKGVAFHKQDLSKTLNEREKKNLDNFLIRMRELDVLKPLDRRGTYGFTNLLTGLYIFMRESKVSKPEES